MSAVGAAHEAPQHSVIRLTDDFLKAPVARAIPGAFYDLQEKAWLLLDPTPRSAAVTLRLFPTLALEYPELAEMRDSLAREMRPFANSERARIPVEAPLTHDQLMQRGSDFYSFQNFDLGYCTQVLMQHGGVYVGWERGLGKTLGSCALIESTGSQYALVVCPNTAKASVWGPELATWLPGHVVVVLRNSRAQREKDLAHVKQLRAEGIPHVLVVHYESLAIIAGDYGKGWDKLGKWDIVVADEAHRIANPKAKMTKALKKIPTLYKVALSGSIIANHMEELFSPLQWLYPKVYRSKWRDWNDRYLDYADGAWGRVCVGVKPDRLDALREELGVFMVYRRKEDELDLPARTEQTLYVDLSPAQTKVYNDLVEDSMAELPDGSFLKAEEGLVLLGRLRQVATGLSLVSAEYNPTTAKTKPPKVFADSTKLDLCIELIKDTEDEAFVVFAWYKASAYELSQRLDAAGIDNYVVTGDTKHDTRAQYIQEFQAGQGRVFIGTLSTLGESVTLHRASNAVFLDRSWNPSTNDQAADRIYRIGQTRPVTITHIVARNTVDEFRVQPVIDDKAALRKLILGS